MNQTPHWADDAIFYHIYPLGFCGAPYQNNFTDPPVNRMDKIYSWIPHMRDLGINALYLGPLFESTAHGYDTANYYEVDRRLGDNQSLADLSSELHHNGIRLILDGVFNHVGRDFWAFRDVKQYQEASIYKDWFSGLRFDTPSPYGDPFTYESWRSHYDLVRLNLQNPSVWNHLFEAIQMWIENFNIDGLRLDVADCLDFDFMREMRIFTSRLKPDFWLMGEVIHGDYRHWVNRDTLHSVTNYECYKGLYSSLVDKNYFEIAYSLNRQFGPDGIYIGLPLYNFADNHDVNRVASSLINSAHLYPLYLLLFTIPGVPSIYYGSEWGVEGKRTSQSDYALRPNLDLDEFTHDSPHPRLAGDISRLSAVRKSIPALRYGDYHQLFVAHEQFAFARTTKQEYMVIMLNAADSPSRMEVKVPGGYTGAMDVLNGNEYFPVKNEILCIEEVSPNWGRILKMGTF